MKKSPENMEERERLRLAVADSLDRMRRMRGLPIRRLAREAAISLQTTHAVLTGATDTKLSTLQELAGAVGCQLCITFHPNPPAGDCGRKP